MTGQERQGRLFGSGPCRLVPGHVRGRRQPCMLVSVLADADAMGALDSADPGPVWQVVGQAWRKALGEDLPWRTEPPTPAAWRVWAALLGACAVALLQRAGLAVFEAAEVLQLPRRETGPAARTTLLLPVMPGRADATRQAWSLVLELFEGAVEVADPMRLERMEERLRAGLASLGRQAPRGGNTPRFLRAAHELGIPVMALAFEGFQYGHGRRAQWLESTLTLQTPGLAVALARDKLAAAARLRQAGLPVPVHQAVFDADEAVRVARRLGYPVVVKPVDRDGGVGVSTGLETEEEVRAAYAGASAVSPRVLIEKHVFGRDYRLTVLDGRLLWAIERIPAGVTGDGVSTVEELVARENRDPRRGEGPHAALKRLSLDDEARRLLAAQTLAADAVPARGREVRLRRIANVNGGGRPVAVNERVHPDNAALAVRAVEALRLDLAGVDVLMPDIARSWLETGAAICEINAQPQLGATTAPHLYGEILRRRLGGDGRIPIVVVLGDAGSPPLSEVLVMQLRQRGWAVGWCDRRGAGIDDEWLVRGGGMFASGQMLLTHPRVDALVLAIHDDEILQTGLPMDRFHWLVLAGTAVSPRVACGPGAGTPGRGSKALLDELLASLVPACSNRVLVVAGSGYSGVGPAQGAKGAGAFEEIGRAELSVALEQFPA